MNEEGTTDWNTTPEEEAVDWLWAGVLGGKTDRSLTRDRKMLSLFPDGFQDRFVVRREFHDGGEFVLMNDTCLL